MKPEVVVVGSANLDLVVDVATIPVAGETIHGGDLQRIPGGKGANQAVAAARLGRRVAMVGRVGDDEAGTMLRAAIASAGVDVTELLTTESTASGVALIAVAADGENSIVVSPGANNRLSPADVESAAGALQSAKVTLLQLEVPVEAVTAAVRCATGVVLLTPAPAPRVPLDEDLLSSIDVIVPNQSELATMTGQAQLAASGEVNAEVAVELARVIPAAAAVVTLGSEGAMVVTPDDACHVRAPQVASLDTTAAGDAFCGALADAFVDGADLVAATQWAVKVGAVSTMRYGAQPSLPSRADVENLLTN